MTLTVPRTNIFFFGHSAVTLGGYSTHNPLRVFVQKDAEQRIRELADVFVRAKLPDAGVSIALLKDSSVGLWVLNVLDFLHDQDVKVRCVLYSYKSKIGDKKQYEQYFTTRPYVTHVIECPSRSEAIFLGMQSGRHRIAYFSKDETAGIERNATHLFDSDATCDQIIELSEQMLPAPLRAACVMNNLRENVPNKLLPMIEDAREQLTQLYNSAQNEGTRVRISVRIDELNNLHNALAVLFERK